MIDDKDWPQSKDELIAGFIAQQSNRLLIPVANEANDSTTVDDIERHCAEEGYIVTNVRPAPPITCISGEIRQDINRVLWNRDCGFVFWTADIVVQEKQLNI